MEKQLFEIWKESKYEKVLGLSVERYKKKSVKDDKTYSLEEIINEYLEYYSKEEWSELDMKEDELTEVIFSINEQVIGELDTGEAPHPMIIGNLLYQNICSFYETKTLPKNIDESYSPKSLLSIHPVIFNLLNEWLESYEDFINWKGSNSEDFWSCFLNDE